MSAGMSQASLANLATVSPGWFAHTVSAGTWVPYAHLVRIDRELLEVVAGRTKLLVISVPPQHGKSEFCSKYFPAWYIGTHPNNRMILTSYNDSYAATWGRKSRDLLEEHGGYYFGVDIDRRSSAANKWDLAGKYEGGLITAGIGGAITGHGAHVTVIDDPVKNQQEAFSETYRERAKDWYRSTLETRMREGGAIVVIMTRWHLDDLAGWLIKEARANPKMPNPVVISFPAIAEGKDVLGRKKGDPLCPQLFTKDTLLAKKRKVGTYWWNALYRQQPVPSEGMLAKKEWFRYHPGITPDELSGFDEVLISWDMSFKETTSSSYVVGQLWARKGADKYLVDRKKSRADFVKTCRMVMDFKARYPDVPTTLVENKANGPAVISALRSRASGLIGVEPKGSKEARMAACTPQIEAGNVYLPEPVTHPWVNDFLEVVSQFPGTDEDDDVDSMTQALNYMPDSVLDLPTDKAEFHGRRELAAAGADRGESDVYIANKRSTQQW